MKKYKKKMGYFFITFLSFYSTMIEYFILFFRDFFSFIKCEKDKTKKNKQSRINTNTLNCVMYCPFHKSERKCVFFHENEDCYEYVKHNRCYNNTMCNKIHNTKSQEYHNSRRKIMDDLRVEDDLDVVNTLKYLLLECKFYESNKENTFTK